MKTVFNIGGNLQTLLSAVVAGTISNEVWNPVMHFMYYWQAQNGAVWAFTDAGYTIRIPTPFAGTPTVSFDGMSLQWMRPKIQTNIGATDSKADLVCFPNVDAPSALSTAQTFFAGAQDGLFDGSVIYIFRYIYSASQNVVGLVTEFVGWVGQTKATREKLTMEVNSIFHQLNLRIPKRMYSPSCTHALYDVGCGLNKVTYGFPLTISFIDPTYPQQKIYFPVYPQVPVGAFNLGTVAFTTGLNAGLSRTIKNDSGQAFLLASTLPNTPQIGDTYTAYFGCDKTLSTCIYKFNNFYNFNGFPFIPAEQIFY